MLFSLSVNGNNREVKCYLESDNWIVQNLNNALETWNSKLSEIWQLLTQSPETFKGGDIWSVMLTIHDALKGIGYGLLVLFFAISVVKTCSSYLDVKKPEHAVKLFIRFALAKGAVGYGLELMMALFSVIQGMVSTIMQNSGFGGDSDVIELPAEMVEKIESVGLLDSIPLWIVTLLGSLFITVLSFIMILTVYGRMFKLYMVHSHSTHSHCDFCGRAYTEHREELCPFLCRGLYGRSNHCTCLHYFFCICCQSAGNRRQQFICGEYCMELCGRADL